MLLPQAVSRNLLYLAAAALYSVCTASPEPGSGGGGAPVCSPVDSAMLERMADIRGAYIEDVSNSDSDPSDVGSHLYYILPTLEMSGAGDEAEPEVWFDVYFICSPGHFFEPAEKVERYRMYLKNNVLEDEKGGLKLHLCYKEGKVDGFYILDPHGADGGTWFYHSKQKLSRRYGVDRRARERIATPPPLPR